ncbi:MAG: hypothetical protein ACRDTG_32685 [Pseudonocardiaceae bacterium]
MPNTATAVLNPVNNSGVSGQLFFTESDDGSLLTVAGTANGMQLLGIYVSLVYGLQSNADVTPPFTGPGPCVDDRTLGVEPAPFPGGNPGDLIFSPSATARMFLPSLWSGALGLPVGTSRSLNVTKPTIAPLGVRLNEIKTVSIRQATIPLLPNILQDIRPQLFSIRACGEIIPV